MLASLVVEQAKTITSQPVLYFYFRYNNSSRNSFVAMARSLLHQVLWIDESLIPYMYETAAVSGERCLNTKKLADKLLETCIQTIGPYIILDGLDECPEIEQKAISYWFRKLVETPGHGSSACRCIFLSQDDATTRSLLSRLPTIQITRNDNQRDIANYCTTWANRIAIKFGLDTQETSSIVSRTSKNADGKLSRLA